MNYVKALRDKVSSDPYITSYTFRTMCQHALMLPNDTEYVKAMGGLFPEQVESGDKIYVVGELLDIFFEQFAPRIKNPYILISGRSDITISQRYEEQLPDNLIKWFAVNNTTDDERIQTIPLGIDNKNWRFDDNPQAIPSHFEVANIEIIDEGSSDVLISFQPHTNKKERMSCLEYFKEQEFSTYRHYTNEDRRHTDFLKNYYREIRKHKFNVCPFGTGYDCHRIWQTLILKSFPIVKKHKSMEEFYDMPIWFVDDWTEVTKENIDNKYKEMLDNYNNQVYNVDKLWFKYWRDLINACVPTDD